MSDIDQAGVIEQLIAENAALREALHDAPRRELQIANALNVLMDELTRLGPRATARAMNWACKHYMKTNTFYESEFWDRRPKEFVPSPPPEPPAPIETTRLELPTDAALVVRRRGRPRKEST